MDHLMKKSLSMGDISQQPAGAQVSYRPANQQIPEEIDETGMPLSLRWMCQLPVTYAKLVLYLLSGLFSSSHGQNVLAFLWSEIQHKL